MKYTYPLYASIRNTDGTLFVLRYTDLTLASVVLDEDMDPDTRYTLGDRVDDWFSHTDPKMTPLNILQLKALGIDWEE